MDTNKAAGHLLCYCIEVDCDYRDFQQNPELSHTHYKCTDTSKCRIADALQALDVDISEGVIL